MILEFKLRITLKFHKVGYMKNNKTLLKQNNEICACVCVCVSTFCFSSSLFRTTVFNSKTATDPAKVLIKIHAHVYVYIYLILSKTRFPARYELILLYMYHTSIRRFPYEFLRRVRKLEFR